MSKPRLFKSSHLKVKIGAKALFLFSFISKLETLCIYSRTWLSFYYYGIIIIY